MNLFKNDSQIQDFMHEIVPILTPLTKKCQILEIKILCTITETQIGLNFKGYEEKMNKIVIAMRENNVNTSSSVLYNSSLHLQEEFRVILSKQFINILSVLKLPLKSNDCEILLEILPSCLRSADAAQIGLKNLEIVSIVKNNELNPAYIEGPSYRVKSLSLNNPTGFSQQT